MKIFYGPKGSGKTKAIIDCANEVKNTAKGHVVFITDTDRYAFDLKQPIRFLNSSEFAINTQEELRGFINGIVAANGDNEYVFVDGIARICDKPLSELNSIFTAMANLEKTFDVKFVLTCSAIKEELPDFILKYID